MIKKVLMTSFLSILLFLPVLPLDTLAQPVVEAKSNLTDINDKHWASNAIELIVNKGYMTSFEDGSFKPNRLITRAETAKVIAKTLHLSLESDTMLRAKDVASSHPDYAEIRKLVELGILANSEKIHPEQPISRSELAKVIALAFQIEVDKRNESSFTDYNKNFWAKHYIESLADAGIFYGKQGLIFDPHGKVSRAELATVLSRSLLFKEGVDNYQIAYDFLAKSYIETPSEHEKWIKDVISLVNVERKKNSLQPLIEDKALNQLAVIKVQDMLERNYFEHKSPYYGNPWDMAALFDYEFSSFGENIARYITSPEEVCKAWLSSKKHRDNILNQSYTNIGIAIKRDGNGKFYWVQMFSSEI
ncbi:S-layer homology domain-containing protein [Lysinibacillus sp. 54212]|uniref:CAP and S-layer homology domain-containing protein n=1 Tax=Lysinibacillus sp. 54212 TaxID=3119829 RepID=UPI002FCC6C24